MPRNKYFDKWAKKLKEEVSPKLRSELLDYTAQLNRLERWVKIEKTDERGIEEYAIIYIPRFEDKYCGNDFWMDSFKLKKDAVKFCKDMNWRIKKC